MVGEVYEVNEEDETYTMGGIHACSGTSCNEDRIYEYIELSL